MWKRVFFTLFLLLVGCTRDSAESELKTAQRFYLKGQLNKAEKIFIRLMKRYPESVEATQGAMKLYEIYIGKKPHRFSEAIRTLRFVIHRAERTADVLEAQRSLAQIYTEHQLDYKKGIIEWNRYIGLEKEKEKKQEARLFLAKAYFFSYQYVQSLSEISILLDSQPHQDIKFRALLLKGKVCLGQKKWDCAIQELESLLKTFPKRSRKEKVAMTLAMVYEERGDLSKAIGVWKKMKMGQKDPEFIDAYIRKLQYRRRSLPKPNRLKK